VLNTITPDLFLTLAMNVSKYGIKQYLTSRQRGQECMAKRIQPLNFNEWRNIIKTTSPNRPQSSKNWFWLVKYCPKKWLNQIEKKILEMPFGLICQKVFDTDCYILNSVANIPFVIVTSPLSRQTLWLVLHHVQLYELTLLL